MALRAPVSAPNYASVAFKASRSTGFCILGPTVCSLTPVGPPCLAPVAVLSAHSTPPGAAWRVSTVGGYGFPGVPQVQSGSRADEPQVTSALCAAGHIRSLTKLLPTGSPPAAGGGGGSPPRAAEKDRFVLWPSRAAFRPLFFNNTGGDGCPSGCEVSPDVPIPGAEQTSKISCIET